jgi:hypothetical protein
MYSLLFNPIKKGFTLTRNNFRSPSFFWETPCTTAPPNAEIPERISRKGDRYT